jgi:hypothetical protein
MAKDEGIYERLGREQQVAAQKFMFRVVIPLLCVVGPLLIKAPGPDYKSVFITIVAYSCLAAILVDAWRTRRGLQSYLWKKDKEE